MTTTARLAPDPAIPSRDRLLDPGWVAEYLRGSAGVAGRLDITGIELVRVKYRLGESLRVLYALETSGRRHLMSGRAFAGGQGRAVYERARLAGVTSQGLRAVIHEGDDDVVWWSFPNDRRLTPLADLLRDPAGRLFTEMPGGPSRERARVVQYTPERSLTLELSASRAVTGFAKVYAAGTVDLPTLACRYDEVAAQLATHHGTRSPRVRGWCSMAGLPVLVLEPLTGRSWIDLEAEELPSVMHRTGQALALVHALPLPRAGTVRSFARLADSRLARTAALVGAAIPEVAGIATGLSRRLIASRPAPVGPVQLHGDCHPGNVLVGDTQVQLLDLDQSGLGPPAAELGSLAARLLYGAAVGERNGELAAASVEEMLSGYATIRDLPDMDSLRWHISAAMLAERAMRAVNRVRPDGLAVLGELLVSGHSLLDGEVAA